MRRMVEPGPRKCCVPTLFPDRGVGNHIDPNLRAFIAHSGIARILECDALDFTAFQDEGAGIAPSNGSVSSRSCLRQSFIIVIRERVRLSENSVRVIQTHRASDARGWLSETFREKDLLSLGIDVRFVQDNHSFSRARGTLRGIHFQVPPHAQNKLVRCARGRIWDVAIDLRNGSSTFGQWVGAELSAENGRQLFIPIGFGHGFLTLEPDCEVIYKISDYYAPDCDQGIRWDDPDIAIDWPATGSPPHLSPRDMALPMLKDFDSPFPYDGRPLLPLAP